MTAATEQAPRWDLETIFPALDDRAFTGALEGIFADVDRLGALYDELDIRDVEPRKPTNADIAALDEVLTATNAMHEELRPVNAYLHGLVTTDSRNERAAALAVELQTRTAALGPLGKRLGAWLAALGIDEFAAGATRRPRTSSRSRRQPPTRTSRWAKRRSRSPPSWGRPGVLAWQRLHGDVSSQLVVSIAGPDGTTERVPMALARGLATHPDGARRRAAYEGELAAWETVAVPLAAALNGAKGALAVLNRRRSYDDDLEPALRYNNVDRGTLDAMTEAVVDSLPSFRGYLRAKARVLGHEGGLPVVGPVRAGGECGRGGLAARDQPRARRVQRLLPAARGTRRTRVHRAMGRRRDP